jgi:hypothetical protein
MLRVQDQAKQAAQTKPPISNSFFEERSFGNTGPPSTEITNGPQVGHRYLNQTRLRQGCAIQTRSKTEKKQLTT